MSSIAFAPGVVYLYNRRYQLELLNAGTASGVKYGNLDGQLSLRVQFEIERDFSSNADKAKITVFNLAPASRNGIARGTIVRLRAGYLSQCDLLFSGYIAKVHTEQQGPDVVTTMECGDGEPLLVYGALNLSYLSAVPLAQVLQDIAAQLSLTIGGAVVEIMPGVIKGIPNEKIPGGSVFTGSVRNALDLLLKTQLIDWAIQNGKLLIMPRFATTYVSAVVLSKTTGLIGVPGIAEDFVTFSSLLNTNIAPGCLVQLATKNEALSGFYKVRKATYQGDTFDAAWNVNCEAEPLAQPLPYVNAPSAQGSNFQTAVVP